MNINEKMNEIANRLNEIKNIPYRDRKKKDYDKSGFVFDLDYTVSQLAYFFDKTVPSQSGCPNSSYYFLKKLEPNEHQIAYINLTRGFPKELFGGHYCYILKKFNDKYIVIPTTSVDDEVTDIKQDFEINIQIKNFINNKVSRLNVSNIKSIDIQRIYQFDNMFEKEKGIFDVLTDRSEIIKEIKKILF